jgi:Recombination endonuclease VII
MPLAKRKKAFACPHKSRPSYAYGLCNACYRRKWIADMTPAQRQEHHLQRNLRGRYGLSLADFRAKLAEQGGVCAICGSDPEYARLCVDHNHTTNQVRDLLCHKCNGVVGQVEKNSDLIERAVAYLAFHENNTDGREA